MALYDQIIGAPGSIHLTSHLVGASWREWIEGEISLLEMWGDAIGPPIVPPWMAWETQTRLDLEAMQTKHANLGLPQQGTYYSRIEGIFILWQSGQYTKAKGEAALF